MRDIEYQQIIQRFKEDNIKDYELGEIRKLFTECLIKQKGYNGKRIDWNSNDRKLVYFIYNNIEGYVEIVNCIKHTERVLIKYNNKRVEMDKTNFINCHLGELLGVFTSEFKVKIGENFKSEKRDIFITDMEYRKDDTGKQWKWYKYTCNVCNWTEGWMPEGSLIGKQEVGCSCCSGNTVVYGINDITTVAPFMIKYFQNPNEAKLYTKYGGGNPDNSKGYINPVCCDCGQIKHKKMRISDIYKRKSISCSCSDNQPYAEKFIFSALNQLGLDFEHHKTFDWSKDIQTDNIELCGRKEYDFSFNNESILLEAHGIQHYEESNRGRSLSIEQENDNIKKELALNNNIKEENYIVIDCRKSELEFIKDNILNDEKMNRLFDLSKIDWLMCEEFALSNRVKEACDLWNKNPNMTTTDIGRIMNLDGQIVRKYLSKGVNLNWCIYDAKVESNKIINDFINSNKKQILYLEKEMLFDSMKQCSDNSEKLFGVKLYENGISRVCLGKQDSYKGFTFKYTSELTEEELSKLQHKQQSLTKAI